MRFGLRFGDERGQRAGGGEDVVRARLLNQVAARSQRCPLDARLPAIGEDVVADARHVAASEVVPQRIVVVLLHRDDPHVDAGAAHRAGEHLLELVETDLALHFPASPRLLGGRGHGDEQHERRRQQMSHDRSPSVARRPKPDACTAVIAAGAPASSRPPGSATRGRPSPPR